VLQGKFLVVAVVAVVVVVAGVVNQERKIMSILKNIMLFLTGCKKADKATPLQDKNAQPKSNPHDSGGCCGHCGGQNK
jgi:hypothetical protein